MKSTRVYLVEQVVINIIINFLIAYSLGRSAMAELESIPLQAPTTSPFDPNMGGEIIVGSFLLGLILTLVMTLITRHNLQRQKINVATYAVSGWIAKLPDALFKRALSVGLLAMLTIGLCAVLLLVVLGVQQADPRYFLWCHSLYMAMLGGIVAYVAVRRALADS